MAIYHFSAQVIGRTSGRSSVQSAAYRLGVELVDHRTGRTHDYRAKAGVDSFHTLAPANAPDWVHDPSELWNRVEAFEKRKDAQLCREFNVALPVELTPEQAKAMALDYAQKHWVDKGMVAQVAFHDLDGKNPHFHAMVTMREIGPEGFNATKNRAWNAKTVLDDWREGWALSANRALELHGHAARIDHRSLEAQGIDDREPEQHQGPKAAAMQARGVEPERTRLPVPRSMDHQAAIDELRREREGQGRARALAECQAKADAANDQARRLEAAKAGAVAQAKADRQQVAREQAEVNALADNAASWHQRSREATKRAAGWQKAHPWLSRLWEPKWVPEARREALEAAQRRDRAKAQGQEQAKALAEQQERASASEARARAVELAHTRAVALAAQQEQAARRMKWEQTPPEQRQPSPMMALLQSRQPIRTLDPPPQARERGRDWGLSR